MKLYVKSSSTDGFVGIWWLYENKVIGRLVSLDDGYDDGRFIHYDNFKNHSTEWKSVLQEQLPDKFDELYPKLFKCIERGRVVYNIRTQCYEILCSEAVSKNSEAIHVIVKAFNLQSCRYDIVPDRHYYIAEPTGNPALDDFEYGV